MSYTPTTWQTGDTITAEKLNHMESGIEDGQTLVVTITRNGGVSVADKTFSEITSAWSAGKTVIADASDVGGIGLLYLTRVNASNVMFSSARGADINTITISSNGTITLSSKYNLYPKPSSGIPQSDLAQAVQNKLDPFVVTLTPTAQDFSGTMDKTPQEITAAYEAGQQIMFNVVGFPGFDHVYIPAAWCTYATGKTICAACATLVDVINNLQIIVVTRDVADVSEYYTDIYPLTPMS